MIKIGKLKDDTPMYEEALALTGVTEHQLHTLGKIRGKITITLRGKKIRHTIYVVKDDFPIAYEGILGIDFLKKHRAKCDHGRKQVRIGDAVLKLYPYKKIALKPRSETILRAATDCNYLDIVKAEEAMPGV